jgi:hypothetical protein
MTKNRGERMKVLHLLLLFWILFCGYLYVTAVEMEIFIFLYAAAIGIFFFPIAYLTILGFRQKKINNKIWSWPFIAAGIWIAIPLCIIGYDLGENEIREYQYEQRIPTRQIVEEDIPLFLGKIFEYHLETTYQNRLLSIDLHLEKTQAKELAALVKEIESELPQNSSISSDEYVEEVLEASINDIWSIPVFIWSKAGHHNQTKLSVWINNEIVGQEHYFKNDYDVQDHSFQIIKENDKLVLVYQKENQDQYIPLN